MTYCRHKPIGVILLSFKDSYQSSNNKNTLSISWDFFFFFCFVIGQCTDVNSQMKNQWDNETQAIRHLLVKLYRENASSTLCFPSYLSLKKRKRKVEEETWCWEREVLHKEKKITDSEESLSLILLGVEKCDLEPNAISRKYFNAWKLKWDFVSFLIYPLAFAQMLSTYPQGPRVGYWCLSLSFCSPFVVERFYRHIKSKGRGTPGAGRALPEDFRTPCVCVCVCVCTVIPCRSGVEESE